MSRSISVAFELPLVGALPIALSIPLRGGFGFSCLVLHRHARLTRIAARIGDLNHASLAKDRLLLELDGRELRARGQRREGRLRLGVASVTAVDGDLLRQDGHASNVALHAVAGKGSLAR